MKRWFRLFALWFFMGGVYYLVELVYRLMFHKGWPHWSMVVVGGMCGVVVGALNQFPRFFRMNVRAQCLVGTGFTLVAELVSGLILNRRLGLDIWDYSDLPLNFMGQICLLFALGWLLLMPFAIWLEDTLRWGFGWNGKAYNLGSIYRDALLGR